MLPAGSIGRVTAISHPLDSISITDDFYLSVWLVFMIIVFISSFYRDLMNEGIFDIITDVLQSQDKKLVLTGWVRQWHSLTFLFICI